MVFIDRSKLWIYFFFVQGVPQSPLKTGDGLYSLKVCIYNSFAFNQRYTGLCVISYPTLPPPPFSLSLQAQTHAPSGYSKSFRPKSQGVLCSINQFEAASVSALCNSTLTLFDVFKRFLCSIYTCTCCFMQQMIESYTTLSETSKLCQNDPHVKSISQNVLKYKKISKT